MRESMFIIAYLALSQGQCLYRRQGASVAAGVRATRTLHHPQDPQETSPGQDSSSSPFNSLPAGPFLFEAVTGHDLPVGVLPRDLTGTPCDCTHRKRRSFDLTIGFEPRPHSEGLGISAHFMWYLVPFLDKQNQHLLISSFTTKSSFGAPVQATSSPPHGLFHCYVKATEC